MPRRPRNDFGFFGNLLERIVAGVISAGIAWLMLMPLYREDSGRTQLWIAGLFGLLVAAIRPSPDSVVRFLTRWR